MEINEKDEKSGQNKTKEKIENNKNNEQKISKKKKKRMKIKEKYMSIKKLEYLNRQKIINSLEQQNKATAQKARKLISTKNLGQKRKRNKSFKKMKMSTKGFE